MKPIRGLFGTTFAGCLLLATTCLAQTETPTTLWSFMGIPQAGRKINGALFNRRGNHPGLERKPALKALADPANLASANPAIKKAAEVKMAEDLKKQKIKAVKYLADIGCGCYDIDGGITEALLAATEDCTEDVRLATVEAIQEKASGQCCANCGQVCCCSEAMVKRLAAMAYHRDDKGCWLEPSARVRQAATQALNACCPSSGPVVIEAEKEPETLPPVVPEGIESDEPEGTDPESTESDDEAATAGWAPIYDLAPVTNAHRAPVVNSPTGDALGVIIHTDSTRRAAHVHFERQDATVRVGTILLAYEQTAEGPRVVGRFRVYQSFDGSANVQEMDAGSFERVVRGTKVMIEPELVALGQPILNQ